jgi:hypothetical protein
MAIADIRSASVRQLEAWSRENDYDIEVTAKEGKPSLWVVTLSSVRDRRKFSHSSYQQIVSGEPGRVEASALTAYADALTGAVAKALSFVGRLSS